MSVSVYLNSIFKTASVDQSAKITVFGTSNSTAASMSLHLSSKLAWHFLKCLYREMSYVCHVMSHMTPFYVFIMSKS